MKARINVTIDSELHEAAKAAASVANGRKGGRPKKITLPLTTRERAERAAREKLG